MENKTEYRIVNNDGYRSYLEYKSVRKIKIFFGLFGEKELVSWHLVPKPYHHDIFGRRGDSLYNYQNYVNNYDFNLKNFVEKWPDISAYLLYFEQEQKKLEAKSKEYKVNLEAKKGITYL